jgi:hypothetical protein
VGIASQQGQSLVIDAAVAARVKRLLPSDFGADIDNPKAKALPVFGYKVATQKHVEDVARANPDFTYTIIRNGVFLDWGLETGFLLSGKQASRLCTTAEINYSALLSIRLVNLGSISQRRFFLIKTSFTLLCTSHKISVHHVTPFFLFHPFSVV